jgi:hypothetical protein
VELILMMVKYQIDMRVQSSMIKNFSSIDKAHVIEVNLVSMM